jgi:hypothetical protein
MSNLIQTALVALTSAILGGVVSSLLAHGLFKKEWWWEQKAAAYSKLIFALHESLQFSEAHIKSFETGSEISAERDVELRRKSEQGDQLINQARDTGVFFLSDKAVDRLKVLAKEQEKAKHSDSWHDHIESNNGATSTCLEDIIVIAKTELASPWYMRYF